MNNKNYIFFAILALTGSAFAQNNIPQLVSADKYQPLVNAQNQVSNGIQQPTPTQKPVAVFGPTPMPKPVAVFGGTAPTSYGGIQNTKPVAVFGGTDPQKPTIPPISTVYPKPVYAGIQNTKPVAVFGGTAPTSYGGIQNTKPVAVFGGTDPQKPTTPTISTVYPTPAPPISTVYPKPVFGGTAPTSNGEIQNTKPVYGGIQNTKPVAVFGGTTK